MVASSLPRGITLLDLVTAVPQGAHELIPDGIARLLEHLSVVESLSRASGAYDIVEGTARSVTDVLGIDIGDGFTVEIPGVTRGLRFSYASNRIAVGTGQNLEPAPTPWQVSLFAERLLVPLPGIAAQRAAAADGFVGPLVADPNRERVHLWISGVVLIGNASGSVRATLASDPDPFQPDAPSGQVIRAGLEPRHVLFGPSGFGMTVGEVIWDQTTAITPPEIVARGHDANWRGLSVSDATLYLPRDLPFVGDVTAGVRDMLIGFAPDNGVQLEAFLQLGQIPEGDGHIEAVRFYQDVDGQLRDLETPPGPEMNRQVEVVSTTAGDPVRVLARLYPPDAEARWRLPGTTTWITGNDTGWLIVRPGDPHDTLAYRDIFTLEGDGGTADGPQITFAFVPDADAEGDGGFPPKVSLTSEPFSWSDVTHVSGSPEHLAGIWFDAIAPIPADPDDRARLTWELRHGGATVTGTGERFEPVISWRAGRHTVVLTDHLQRRRRLEVEVIDDADRMVIGCAFIDGPAPEADRRGPRLLVDEVDEPATPTAVVASYHLRAFHQDGVFRPSDEPATLSPLVVPDGALAELALAEEDDDQTHVLSAVRVRMEFDSTDPVLYREIHPVDFVTDEPGFEGTHVDPWGPADPYPVWDPDDPTVGGADRLLGFPEGADPDSSAAAVLRGWAAYVLAVDPAARFVVIGRACDIGDVAYNAGLGGRRAAHGRALLTDPSFGDGALDPAIVYTRGENQPESSAIGTRPADPTVLADLSDPELSARSLAERTQVEFRITVDHADRMAEWGDSRAIPEREEARGFDIYAAVPDPWQATLGDGDAVAGARRRALVPGADQWAHITEPPRERILNVAMRLLAKWDSPSWADAQDSAPTLVEAALDWESAPLELPEIGAGQVQPEPTDGSDPEGKVWQVVVRFTRDPRTRQMIVSGALDTPGSDEGIFRIADNSDDGSGIASDLALVLALGPALATGVDAGDVEESVVPLAALGAVALASVLFDVASNGVTTVHRLEFGYGRAAGGGDAQAANRIWLYADYTAAFDVSLPAGLATGTGVAVRYRRAGIELGYDVSPANVDSLGLVYEEGAEIVTPGTWTMSNALARLLGVVAVRMGAGSFWLEVDLVMAIDLGPITLEEATLRLTLGAEVVFEVRGLTVSVEIPGVLSGVGKLALTEGDSGKLDVSARLDLAIEPIGLQIDAAFKYEDPMVHLEVAILFATAIPLLNTGLGLFGLQGRFVSNGTRDLLPADVEPDPVQRELAWYEKDLLEKYRPEQGQVAIGLGATVGTQADAGFTFNLNGMIVVELPDPSVVLTVAARFMSFPEGVEEDADAGSTTSAGLLGIVAISGDGIAVGIRGTYGVPKLLDVQIPVAAWFPFRGDLAGYVRIGSDGFEGRAGDPVTITVLPGTLDLEAWSYLMIEQKALPNLGGKAEFDFTGFSIGFGAGYDFEWGGRTVYLRAGSSIIVGLGTKPLFIKGELTVGGELRLGPVGVSIDGNILLTLTEDDAQLSGEFCGEVDLALFKAKGCVNITLGGAAEPAIEAEPLVSGLSLTDRYARVVATGRAPQAGSIPPENTAWVDCRPTLHFSKRVLGALDAGSFTPTPANGWGADWSGSARTKFLFRLRAVELLDDDDAVVADAADWPSTWWMPAGRPAFPVEGDAPSSEHETWDLALLAWDPAPWARSLLDGGTGSDGDPATMIERLCEPGPETTPHCVYGADGVRLEPGRVKFAAPVVGPLPWRSGATLVGTETIGLPLDASLIWAELMGYRYAPSRVVRLPAPWTDPDTGIEVTSVWLLPGFTHDDEEREPVTFGLDGTYSADVDDPDLTVALHVPIPVNGSEAEVCFEFDDLGDGPDAPPEIDYGVIRLTGQTGLVYDGDGDYQLVFEEELAIDIGYELPPYSYGPATRVEATVTYLGVEPIHMRALDGDGVVLAEANLPTNVSPQVPYRLVITRPGIERVELWAAVAVPQALLLDTFCVQLVLGVDEALAAERLTEYFEEVAELVAPTATGLRAQDERGWTPELLDVVSSDRDVAAIVRYRPEAGDDGPWTGVRLAPMPVLDVGIVSSCFTTSAAADAADAVSQAATDVLDEWNGSWSAAEDRRVVLLDADRSWQVRVRYDVATWNQDGDAGPPSASSLDWDDAPSSVTIDSDVTQSFEFGTAAAGALPEADLLRFDVQHTFDPQALVRYIVGFDPDRTTRRHFLDDMLLVHFEVEWIETLLEKYDHELSLDVVRTDPPPGTSRGIEDRLVASTVTWTSTTSTMQSSPADATMAVAALLAPCVDGPQPQGVTAAIAADLEPLAEYDLVVRAVPTNRPFDPGEVITRAHFGTSAFRDADELLAHLGFDAAATDPNPFFALEAIATTAAPTDVVLGDDVALDQTLALLGLDPLPLSTEPTTRLLWVDDGGWKIAGLLLDSTEALERPPRLEDILRDSPPPQGPTVDGNAILAGETFVAVRLSSTSEVVDYVEAPKRLTMTAARVGSVSLTPRRSNASATRVLLVPDAPFDPATEGSTIELEWSDRGRTRRADRYLPAVPRLVSQEFV